MTPVNFTKIVTPNNNWQYIITDELDTSKKIPYCILAGRFNVYKLKVLSQNLTIDRMIAFIIEGDEMEGQCIVFFKIELFCDMIVEFSIKKAISFDRELALLLTYALLKRLQKMEVHNISPNLFPYRLQNRIR